MKFALLFTALSAPSVAGCADEPPAPKNDDRIGGSGKRASRRTICRAWCRRGQPGSGAEMSAMEAAGPWKSCLSAARGSTGESGCGQGADCQPTVTPAKARSTFLRMKLPPRLILSLCAVAPLRAALDESAARHSRPWAARARGNEAQPARRRKDCGAGRAGCAVARCSRRWGKAAPSPITGCAWRGTPSSRTRAVVARRSRWPRSRLFSTPRMPRRRGDWRP